MSWTPPLLRPAPMQPVKKQLLHGGGHAARPLIKVTDEDARKTLGEIVLSCSWFNDILKSINIPFRLDPTRLQKILSGPISEDWKDACRPVKLGTFKGTFSKEHVITICDVCYHYFHHEHRESPHLFIWGACQGAKTMVFAGSFLLIPVLERLLNGKFIIPIINTPNIRNLQLGAQNELATTARLYGEVEVVDVNDKSNRYSLNYVRKEILDGIISGSSGTKDWDNLVLQRNETNLSAFLDSASKEHECEVVNFIDEMHIGSQVDSILDKWENKFKENHPGVALRHIGISATPSEVWATTWGRVRLWLPDDYLGLPCYNGDWLPTISGNRPKLPEIASVEETFPEFNLDRKMFTDRDYFAKAVGLETASLQTKRESHEEHRQKFAEAIYKIYKKSVTKEYSIFFLRPFSKVDDCRELYNRLQDLSQAEGNKYEILRYFDTKLDDVFGGRSSKTEPRTLRQVLIEEYVQKGRFCMVLAAQGRSRQGDSFPRQCRHFMDLMEDSVGWDSMVQSTFGRSMGLGGKKSICYFPSHYINNHKTGLQKFIDSEGFCKSKQYNNRTPYRSRHKHRGRPSKQRVLLLPPKDCRSSDLKDNETDLTQFPELYNKIKNALDKNLNKWKRVDGSVYDLANKDFYENIFSTEIMAELSQITGDYYPEWGSQQPWGKEETMLMGGKNGKKYVPVGLRFVENFEAWKTGPAKQAAAKRVRTNHGGIWRPQIVVTMSSTKLYKHFDTTCRARKDLGLLQNKCEKDPNWGNVELVPLYIFLPAEIGTPPSSKIQPTGRKANIFANEKSRYWDQNANNFDTENALTENLEKIYRQVAQKWS